MHRPAGVAAAVLAAGVWLTAVFAALGAGAAVAEDMPERLGGHGGPVKGIAFAPAGDRMATASFDYSVVLRAWPSGSEQAVLIGHEAAVNAAAFTPDGRRLVSVGDDGLVLVWPASAAGTGARPLARLDGHTAKVLQVVVSGDGRLAATAAWDGMIGLWSLDPPSRLALVPGHAGPVNAVAFGARGRALFSAGYDGTIRAWSLPPADDLAGFATGVRQERLLVRHGFGINVMALDEAAGRLAFGALDGAMRLIMIADGDGPPGVELDRAPVLALALSHDRRRVAFGNGQGLVTVVDAADGRVAQDFIAAGGPVWALAFGPGDDALLVGGRENTVAVWPLDPLKRPADDTAAPRAARKETSNGEGQFIRKCQICHTLGPDTARRAGPTLYGLIGRKVGTVPGYPYSAALAGSSLVWTEETIAGLFTEGPDVLLPGTKMPLQRLTNTRDRDDLIEYLKDATRPRKGTLK